MVPNRGDYSCKSPRKIHAFWGMFVHLRLCAAQHWNNHKKCFEYGSWAPSGGYAGLSCCTIGRFLVALGDAQFVAREAYVRPWKDSKACSPHAFSTWFTPMWGFILNPYDNDINISQHISTLNFITVIPFPSIRGFSRRLSGAQGTSPGDELQRCPLRGLKCWRWIWWRYPAW